MIKHWLKPLLGTVVVGVGLGLVLTNPDPNQYSDYASRALGIYLKREVCEAKPTFLRGILTCDSLVTTLHPTFKTIFNTNTQHHNWGFFSLYVTEVTPASVASFLPPDAFPGYHFETLAVFNRFITYKIKQSHPPQN